MNNEPVLYNPDEPLAHYEQSGKRYKKVKKRLSLGIIAPIPALALGGACIIFNPWLMAVFAFFSIPFTLLSIIGCVTRREKMCLVAVPIGAVLAVLSIISGSVLAPLGAAAYLLAAFAEFIAVSAASEFYELKELPGFPFFDPAMDDISFAAKDHYGADEFIDESKLYTEKKTYRFDPSELEPSDEMDEIVTGVSLLKEGDIPLPAEEFSEDTTGTAEKGTEPELTAKDLAPEIRSEGTYERMIKVKKESRNEISDVELFG
ncbi:MAG: hypothetical protein K2N26_07720 [Oscillospiraceae bacterium]|nr:hypothetical protein [Oscillospiraceae bacterium]